MPNDDSVEEQYHPQYYYDYYEDRFLEDEDYYNDPNEFTPRIEGTELEIGLAFLWSNYFPIITSRVNNGQRKYYLFDVIKVWQTVELDDINE